MAQEKIRYGYLIGETYLDGDETCVVERIDQIHSGKNKRNIYTLWYPETDRRRQVDVKEIKTKLLGPFGPYAGFKQPPAPKKMPEYKPMAEQAKNNKPQKNVTKMDVYRAFMAVYEKMGLKADIHLMIMDAVAEELLRGGGEENGQEGVKTVG